MSKNDDDRDLGPTWVQVSTDGTALCQITLRGALLPALVRVASSKPSDGLLDGTRLTALHPFWGIDDLAAGQKVWARASGFSSRIGIN